MRRRFSPHLASSDPSLTVDRLRAFVSQGVVNQVHLVGVDNGFALLVHLRTGPLWLHTEKSQQRRVLAGWRPPCDSWPMLASSMSTAWI